MVRHRPGRPPLLALVLAIGLVAVGCGGDSAGPSSGQAPPAQTSRSAQTSGAVPRAEVPVSESVGQLEDFAAARTCAERLKYLRTLGPDGKPGNSATDCEIAQEVSNDLGDVLPFRSAKSREFGIGAVTDVTTRGGDREAVLWTLDADGRYTFLSRFGVTEPELATRVDDSPNFDRDVVSKWLDAIAERDCPQVYELFVADSVKVAGRSQKEFCALLDEAYENEDGFIGRVAANPDAQPRFLGGTENAAFHGLRLGNAYYAIITAPAAIDAASAKHAKYGIVDYPAVEPPR